jgi:hypothetical protein
MSDFLDHLIAQALPAVTPPLAPRTPSRFEPVDFERLDAGADAGQAPPARIETAPPAPPPPTGRMEQPTAPEAAPMLQRPAPAPSAARAPSHARPAEPAAAPASEPASPDPPSTRRARIPSSVPDPPFAEPPSPHRHRDTETADVPKPAEGPSPGPAAPVESVRERATVEVVPRDSAPVPPRPALPPQTQAAVRPSLPPAVAAPAAPSPPPPTVEVRIGRIEIVAPSAPAPAEAPRPAQPAGDSRLERYLARS